MTLPSRLLRALALLALASPFACGGTTAATTDGDASTDGGAQTDGPSIVDASQPPTCSRSTQLCGGRCVDTMNDPANCGACGHACSASSACAMSTCQPSGLPPDPGGPPGDAAGSIVFAFSKVFLGDTDRSGVASQTAWKQYGLDLDGKTTDKSSTDVCTLASGAAKSTQTDGLHGIDNSWGENILPIFLTTAGQDFGKKVNDAINAGAFTNLVRIDHLGLAPTYSSLTSALFTGAPIGSPPTWNGNDAWPVDTSSLNNGDVMMPKALFTGGYLNNRVWVSGTSAGRVTLPLTMGGIAFAIPIDHAVLSMRIDANDQSAVDGVLAGVIPTEEFLVAFKQVAGRISTSLCQGAAFDSIAQQVRQANDILLDGTNRAGVPCSGISIGIGFEAKRVQLGSVVTPPTSPDPCH